MNGDLLLLILKIFLRQRLKVGAMPMDETPLPERAGLGRLHPRGDDLVQIQTDIFRVNLQIFQTLLRQGDEVFEKKGLKMVFFPVLRSWLFF